MGFEELTVKNLQEWERIVHKASAIIMREWTEEFRNLRQNQRDRERGGE